MLPKLFLERMKKLLGEEGRYTSHLFLQKG